MLSLKNLNVIVILKGLALAGLVAIQVYWFKNAVETEREQLRHRVNQAITSSVEKLEREHYSQNVLSHREIQEVMQDFHHRVEMDAHVVERDVQIIDSIIERDGENVVVRIVQGSANDSAQGIRAETRLFRESVGVDSLEHIVGPDGLTIMSGDKTLQITNEQIVDRIHVVSDILMQVLDEKTYQPVEQRVDVKELDSILKSELANNGISEDFNFSICNKEGKCFKFDDLSGTSYRAGMKNTPYKTVLFPGDVTGGESRTTYLLVDMPDENKIILKRIWWVLLLSIVFIGLIIYAFYYTVSTILKQKKLSVIKTDFINNMTHELKTPISTISLACEALNDPDVSKSQTANSNYVNMISEENLRLGALVERVLQSAVIEKGELKLKKDHVDLHDLIRASVSRFKLKAENKGGSISIGLEAKDHAIQGDQVHLSNVFANLIDNAIKYSDKEPLVEISTSSGSDFTFVIKDHGIGIHKEYQKKIFDNLFRIPTGNVHDVKGFGIGLSYVKAIVENHGGTIDVHSELGSGSTFTLKLPLK